MTLAGIYQLKDRIFIHPWQLTETGLGMGTEPYVALPLEVEPANLGKAALDALNQSGRTVPHPTDWKAQRAARLKAAGVKSAAGQPLLHNMAYYTLNYIPAP